MHTPQDVKQNLAISAMTAFFTFYAYTQSTQWVPEITLYIIFCISIAYAAMMCRELWVLNHSKARAPRIVRSADNGKVR